ncbi:DUF6370 family protein [Flavobacterium sp. 3HN19-14]|uniref:DUF6370 family protein n=1 Tax=Flavobacterium sp. 3HN19-14 TaxID=3448133 RepID=UPI003EE35A04
MKNLIIVAVLFITNMLCAQKVTNKVVDVACGECKFGMKGDACDMAVKIDGKTYFVDGAKKMEAYVDPHAKNGFCNAVRQATVSGEIVGNRFKATSFELVAEKPKAKSK